MLTARLSTVICGITKADKCTSAIVAGTSSRHVPPIKTIACGFYQTLMLEMPAPILQQLGTQRIRFTTPENRFAQLLEAGMRESKQQT